MSNPVFYAVRGLIVVAAVLAFLFLKVFNVLAAGVAFIVITVFLLALLIWITWVRRQYSFKGGGMMEKVHKEILSELDYDGKGTLLEVGCGSGALAIRAALTWPEAKIIGVDCRGASFDYSKALFLA